MRTWRWGWFVLALAIVPAILVPFIALISYTQSSFAPCLPCHNTGKAAYALELKIVTGERFCVEPTEYMRVKHGDLLKEWRESVVREGNRIYVASDGKQYNIGLTATCMKCHWNKAEFCDRCHNYVRKKPDCWNCHIPPKGD